MSPKWLGRVAVNIFLYLAWCKETVHQEDIITDAPRINKVQVGLQEVGGVHEPSADFSGVPSNIF